MQKISRLNGWMTDPAPSVSQLQRHWLTRPGALTRGLRSLGVLTLRVLSENVCRAGQDEAARLALPIGHALWQREVCMSILGVDCVVARSVTPLKASNGQWQAVRQLRNRPLADILYHDRAIARSEFEFTTVRLGMPLYRLAPLNFATPLQPSSPRAFGIPSQPLTQAAPTSPARVFARRSVFVRAHQPLLVAEAFLPAFWNIALGTKSEHSA
jgi:chorismate--pyruvate lyase